MKAPLKYVLILSFFVLLSDCSDNDFQGFDISPLNFLNAATHDACATTINFRGVDIYGYLLSDGIFDDYWQIGGHPANAVNELPDLGINIFAAQLETGSYEVTADFIMGKALIYYKDENGIEYNSTNNNTGNVNVVFSPGSFNRIEITFNNVEVYNDTLDETKCVNAFNYSYAY